MKEYLRLLSQCRQMGVRQKNRTGIDTFMIPGGMMQFDCSQGFPILTTKRIAFQSVVGETLGFVRGYSNAEQFRQLKCMWWDKNANENEQWVSNGFRKGRDDLGRIYGVQWRRWGEMTGYRGLDQIAKLLILIKNDPTSRRMIVTAWNPDELSKMALPPCHMIWQVLIEQERRIMHMTMTMRSCDMFLGVPMNITSYATLLHMLAYCTGYQAGRLTMFLSDVHIYENHLEQVDEILTREPKARPHLDIQVPQPPNNVPEQLQWLETINPWDFAIDGYDPHPPIKAEMAV